MKKGFCYATQQIEIVINKSYKNKTSEFKALDNVSGIDVINCLHGLTDRKMHKAFENVHTTNLPNEHTIFSRTLKLNLHSAV